MQGWSVITELILSCVVFYLSISQNLFFCTKNGFLLLSYFGFLSAEQRSLLLNEASFLFLTPFLFKLSWGGNLPTTIYFSFSDSWNYLNPWLFHSVFVLCGATPRKSLTSPLDFSTFCHPEHHFEAEWKLCLIYFYNKHLKSVACTYLQVPAFKNVGKTAISLPLQPQFFLSTSLPALHYLQTAFFPFSSLQNNWSAFVNINYQVLPKTWLHPCHGLDSLTIFKIQTV